MNTNGASTTHLCRLSFCTLILYVLDGALHIRFPKYAPHDTEIPERSMTDTDAVHLVHFIFHNDRLGPDLCALFFEWKETLELLEIFRKSKTSGLYSASDALVQHLYIVSRRYWELITSRCDLESDAELFLSLASAAISKSAATVQ